MRGLPLVGEMESETTSAEPEAALATSICVFCTDAGPAVGTLRDG